MPEKIHLGGFDIDISKAIRELKYDLKDDWFPDPIRFRDCLNQETILGFYSQNIKNNHGQYMPEKALIFNVPKNTFLVRYSLETHVYDRLIYLGIVSYLIPFYDPLLSPQSFSHRYASNGKGRKVYLNFL